MFVGWVRTDTLERDLDEFEKKYVCDKNLILNTALYSQRLCFGVYDKDILRALISAYEFEDSVYINNFLYDKSINKEHKTRLIKLLEENINKKDKTHYILARDDETELFSEFGCKSYAKFIKVFYSGGAVFNFTNSMSKSIDNENYMPSLIKVDRACTKESRAEYITKNIFKTSSLVLSTQNGYEHSYALNKNVIKLSPFMVNHFAFDDAQKMLRGVIYHRGLKKILAFIPKDVEEITNLYRSYKFEFLEEYSLMYKNEKPNIDLEMVYGF